MEKLLMEERNPGLARIFSEFRILQYFRIDGEQVFLSGKTNICWFIPKRSGHNLLE
jgi:hypothetical protein